LDDVPDAGDACDAGFRHAYHWSPEPMFAADMRLE
jgi:hypothetical protein